MTDPVTLFCLIGGESFENVFSITIDRAETVSVLRELVINKNRLNQPARHLRLWKVSIPDGGEKALQLQHLPNCNALRPMWKISKVFPEEPPEESIHIIVDRWDAGLVGRGNSH